MTRGGVDGGALGCAPRRMAADVATRLARGDGLGSGPAASRSAKAGPPPCATAARQRTAAADPVLRLVWLSDVHARPEAKATEGFARALHCAQSLQPPAEAILNGGDCVFDSLKADRDSTLAQWQAFLGVLEANLRIPIYHAIGNHDVWGWGLSDPSIQSDPLYGKGFALKELGLDNPYYSFDMGVWHFIVLDSTHPSILAAGAPRSGIPYTGKLDEDQFTWLTRELNATPSNKPICIVSHIPLFSACGLIDGPNEASGNWLVPGAWMHIDARRLVSLFHVHPNVRVCLSGHIHEYEHVEFAGHDGGDSTVCNHSVSYWCNGAVCGGWWKGSYLGFPPALAAISLYSNGTVDNQFIPYDEVWGDAATASEPPES